MTQQHPEGDDFTPYLLRGPQPAPGKNGRWLVIGLVILLLALVISVAVPLALSHNNGVKPPPDQAPRHTTPTATPSG